MFFSSAPIRYSNETHHMGLYREHSVSVCQFLVRTGVFWVKHTSAVYDEKRTEQKTSAKTSTRQPPLETSTTNGYLGYFYKGFLKNIR